MIDLRTIEMIRRQHATDTHRIYHVTGSCDTCNLLAQWDLLNKALHDITPGGSEFVNNPERCIRWIQDRFESLHKRAIRRMDSE